VNVFGPIVRPFCEIVVVVGCATAMTLSKSNEQISRHNIVVHPIIPSGHDKKDIVSRASLTAFVNAVGE